MTDRCVHLPIRTQEIFHGCISSQRISEHLRLRLGCEASQDFERRRLIMQHTTSALPQFILFLTVPDQPDKKINHQFCETKELVQPIKKRMKVLWWTEVEQRLWTRADVQTKSVHGAVTWSGEKKPRQRVQMMKEKHVETERQGAERHGLHQAPPTPPCTLFIWTTTRFKPFVSNKQNFYIS